MFEFIGIFTVIVLGAAALVILILGLVAAFEAPTKQDVRSIVYEEQEYLLERINNIEDEFYELRNKVGSKKH